MAELTYKRAGDYYIPNLLLAPEPTEPTRESGFYGRMRRTYLKQHRRSLYRELIASGKLQDHLLDIEDTARDWLDRIIPKMTKAAGTTEDLKARDQMAWVSLMNNCKASVKEIIRADLIYS